MLARMHRLAQELVSLIALRLDRLKRVLISLALERLERAYRAHRVLTDLISKNA